MTPPIQPEPTNPNPQPTEPQAEPVVVTNQPSLSQADLDARLQQQQQLYNAAMQEQQSRIRQQEMELAEYRARQQNTQPNYQQLNEQYIANPAEVTAQIVSQQIQKQVAPIANRLENFMRVQSYNSSKGAFRGMAHWNVIEPQIDQYFASNPNVDPTQQTIQALYYMFLGQLTVQNPTVLRQPSPQPAAIPAQLQPSTPPMPAPSDGKIQLTELQKRLARENGLSDEQYLELLNADQRDFMTTQPTWRAK